MKTLIIFGLFVLAVVVSARPNQARYRPHHGKPPPCREEFADGTIIREHDCRGSFNCTEGPKTEELGDGTKILKFFCDKPDSHDREDNNTRRRAEGDRDDKDDGDDDCDEDSDSKDNDSADSDDSDEKGEKKPWDRRGGMQRSRNQGFSGRMSGFRVGRRWRTRHRRQADADAPKPKCKCIMRPNKFLNSKWGEPCQVQVILKNGEKQKGPSGIPRSCQESKQCIVVENKTCVQKQNGQEQEVNIKVSYCLATPPVEIPKNVVVN